MLVPLFLNYKSSNDMSHMLGYPTRDSKSDIPSRKSQMIYLEYLSAIYVHS